MLAKLTSKNQITLPKAAIQNIGAVEYFEVSTEDGRIILTPVRMQKLDKIHDKMQKLGITEEDVADAVAWARRKEK